MGEWLLGVDVDAAFHRHLRRWKVRVVRSADDNGIDLLVHFVKHFAEVFKEWLVSPPLLHIAGALVMVDIAERNEVLFRAALVVGLLRNPAAGADESNIQLVIRRFSGLANREGRTGCIWSPNKVAHRLAHRIPDQIIRLGIGVPVVALPGWRIFLRTPKITRSDEGHIALKLRILCDRGLRLHE